MSRDISIKKGLDWITVFMYLFFVIFGWLNIYGASYDFDQSSIFSFDNRAGKQFVWILTAFVLICVILLIDYKIYNSIITNFIYIAVLGLLVLTIFIAPDVKGSHSWLVLGPISIQPAEFAKVATALALARYVDMHNKNKTLREYFFMCVITFTPCLLIILQKETGSALVFLSLLLVFYREGMNGIILLLGALAVVLFIVVIRFSEFTLPFGAGTLGIILSIGIILVVQMGYLYFRKKRKKEALILLGILVFLSLASYVLGMFFKLNYNYVALILAGVSCVYWVVIALMNRQLRLGGLIIFTVTAVVFCFASNYIFDSILKPHQQIRIKVVLNMEDDPTGAGYNVNQSKIAIGSGGVLGKGFLNGTQTKLKYVPEQDTDFIFCTVGEEFGFIGSAGTLLLFLLFLYRLLIIAERQRETFNRVYGYCVASIFFFHIMVNIGMVLGVMPVIGIPLPFFSYGGSSLWSFTILLFILLRLDASRKEQLR